MTALKKISVFLCVLQITSFCLPSITFGAVYKDIPPTHWAYSAIENMAEKGYLQDFQSENFKPDGYIDKFTVSKILAAVSGYKPNSGDYSPQINIISKFTQKYSKWYTEANNQIAYLLSKNILSEEDLEGFMLFSDDGSEKFRAVSREETAVFFVRLMGKTNEAEQLKDLSSFNDSGSITPSRKGSVNYLKKINILNGDSNGFCHPKNAVTKAEFCVLLNNLTETISKEKTDENSGVTNNSSVNNITSISGVITNYYKTLNIIQLKTDGEINTYRLSSEVKIKLNGEKADYTSIKSNLQASAVINNSEIIELSLSNSINDTSLNQTETETEYETETSKTVSENLCMDSSAKGTIQSIKLGQTIKNECLLGILTENGTLKYFSATRYTVPLYALKIGCLVEIEAKDGQIISLKLGKASGKHAITGYVADITDDSITLRDTILDETEYFYNENLTECYDCTKGKKIDFNDIKKYTEVYIVCEDMNSRSIDVIFVLDNL